ncbi:MAG: hypothetical protein AAF337_14160 [Pseudomonadota bacterium]
MNANAANRPVFTLLRHGNRIVLPQVQQRTATAGRNRDEHAKIPNCIAWKGKTCADLIFVKRALMMPNPSDGLILFYQRTAQTALAEPAGNLILRRINATEKRVVAFKTHKTLLTDIL